MSYYLNVVSIRSVRDMYLSMFNAVATEHNLTIAHKEPLYDWLITNAVNEIIRLTCKGSVIGHYTDELFETIYKDVSPDDILFANESIGFLLEKSINSLFQANNKELKPKERIKVLVMEDTLIIARTSYV